MVGLIIIIIGQIKSIKVLKGYWGLFGLYKESKIPTVIIKINIIKELKKRIMKIIVSKGTVIIVLYNVIV